MAITTTNKIEKIDYSNLLTQKTTSNNVDWDNLFDLWGVEHKYRATLRHNLQKGAILSDEQKKSMISSGWLKRNFLFLEKWDKFITANNLTL